MVINTLRHKIISQHGVAAIEKAKERLCDNCNHPFQCSIAHLLPLTTKGEDCPYFDKKEIR